MSVESAVRQLVEHGRDHGLDQDAITVYTFGLTAQERPEAVARAKEILRLERPEIDAEWPT